MKYLLILSLSLISISPLFSQESQDPILTTPDGWRSELIPFPLPFAPSLGYEGVEDIRFSKGWSDQQSEEFWTYAFVWYLTKDPQLTAQKLERDFRLYFNGLMKAVAEGNGDKFESQHETLALFQKTSANDKSDYIGKVRIHDAFFSKGPMTLNLKVKTSYCEKADRHTVLFYVSPKAFGDEVWTGFNKIQLLTPCN